MSESITFGSVHQKRSARAQTLRNARANRRKSRFEAKKEIGGPTQRLYQFTLAPMILPSIPEDCGTGIWQSTDPQHSRRAPAE